MIPLDWYPGTLWVDVPNGTPAYTAGDVVGGLLTLPVSLRATDPIGLIESAVLVDREKLDAAFTLYLFSSKPTVIADGDSFDAGITDADLEKLIGEPLTLSTYTDYNNARSRAVAAYTAGLEPRWGLTTDANGDSEPECSDGNIYAYLRCTATPNWVAANVISLGLNAWRL